MVSRALPPAFGGGALRAYRYAGRLERINRLGLLVGEGRNPDVNELMEVGGTEDINRKRVAILNENPLSVHSDLKEGICPRYGRL